MAAPDSFPRYGVFPVLSTPRHTRNTPDGDGPGGLAYRGLPAHIPVAAAAHLRPLLTAAPRPGSVLTSGRLAAYVRVEPFLSDAASDAVGARPQIVAVVAPGAIVPAGALVLPAGVSPSVVLPVGRTVVIGGGRVVVNTGTDVETGGHAPPLVLRPARWFAAPRVVAGTPSAQAARVLAHRLAALPTPPDDVEQARSSAVEAARALAEGRREQATWLLAGHLGLGPGATPSGDDVAAGVLLAARAVTAPHALEDVDYVAARIAEIATVRTTSVSAALLEDAAAGWCAEPVVRALAVLVPPARCRVPTQRTRAHSEVDRAFDDLLALGHHSGADLATGLLAVVATATGQPAQAGTTTTWRSA